MNNPELLDLVFAGIGSRETPDNVMGHMTQVAGAIDEMGGTLRSGGAKGADDAFEQGVVSLRKEIYTPWDKFNGRTGPQCFVLTSQPLIVQQKAQLLAQRYHPAWNACTSGAQKLLTRNTMQVLGRQLNSPSLFVLCWAKGVKWDRDGLIYDVQGGTGLAVRLAHALHIPVIHMSDMAHKVYIQALMDRDHAGFLDIMVKDGLLRPTVSQALAELMEDFNALFSTPSPPSIVAEAAGAADRSVRGRWRRNK